GRAEGLTAAGMEVVAAAARWAVGRRGLEVDEAQAGLAMNAEPLVVAVVPATGVIAGDHAWHGPAEVHEHELAESARRRRVPQLSVIAFRDVRDLESRGSPRLTAEGAPLLLVAGALGIAIEEQQLARESHPELHEEGLALAELHAVVPGEVD